MHSGVQLAPRSLVVSLDIGTHGSGFAFATRTTAGGHTPVKLHEAWPAQPAPYPKTRSAILYDGRSPIAWGYSAIRKLCDLQDAGHDISRYHLVKDFKLALQDAGQAAALPPGLRPETVMADFLTFLRKYTLEQLSGEVGAAAARLENIQWCLTVPAMWSEGSKALMRTAALRAGLIRTANSDALTIILEPEAAALHALDKQAPPLVAGMSVMVLDVGGGTADATVHNCQALGGQAVLSEATCAEGALCGSVFVDAEFKAYYRAAVGATAFDAWSSQYPASLQQVIDKWEAVKCSFASDHTGSLSQSLGQLGLNADGLGSGPAMRVPIPPELARLMTQEQRAALQRQQQGQTTEVLLSSAVLRQLFQGPVEAVCRLAVSQLRAATSLGASGPCSMVLLVGGFARSPYLQARVRAAVVATGLTRQLVVPPAPHAAVLGGAVVYGFSPARIHARRSRMMYGVRCSSPYVEGAPGKFMHEEEKVWYTNGMLQVYCKKNELIAHNQEVVHTFSPLYQSLTSVTNQLYATDNNTTKYVEDSDVNMKKLGELTVTVPPHAPGANRSIRVRLKFGQSAIAASAWDEATHTVVDTSIVFAHS
ncbi:hypothetical protein V8C86DRAFT_2583839 [Haematococcus lacustris]